MRLILSPTDTETYDTNPIEIIFFQPTLTHTPVDSRQSTFLLITSESTIPFPTRVHTVHNSPSDASRPPSPMMRTLVKGQTKTTTPHSPSKPDGTPANSKTHAKHHKPTPERSSRAITRRARTNYLFPIDYCLLDQPRWCHTITELCPDHDDTLLRSHSQQPTSHDTIPPTLPAGHICLPSERC